MADVMERKLAMVAELTGKETILNEPSMHAENRFLRAENDMLKLKLKESEDLMTLVNRQSEMVS